MKRSFAIACLVLAIGCGPGGEAGQDAGGQGGRACSSVAGGSGSANPGNPAAPVMSNINPRLRTSFCALADADVTIGMFDSGVGPNAVVAAALAQPTIKGLQRNTVVCPHPALVTDHDTSRATDPGSEGDGYFAGGLPVDVLECPCDAAQGLICSADLEGRPPGPTDRCVAFPIIRQGADFTLRGHNFWDAESAALVLNPVGGGNGTTATLIAHASGIDTNGTDRDCLDANGKTNLTHDALTFRTSATPGFYRLRVFNRNGTFRLRQEPPLAPGRIVHVCWKLNGQSFVPEPTTNLSCAEDALASTTCPADGAACPATAWTVAPRALDAACQHNFLQPIRCGETPNWFGSEADPRFQPIVFVE